MDRSTQTRSRDSHRGVVVEGLLPEPEAALFAIADGSRYSLHPLLASVTKSPMMTCT